MKPYLAALFVLVSALCNGQRYQDYVALGDMSLEAGDPYGALRYYEIAMGMDSTRSGLHYKYATAHRLNANYSKAAYYYYKVYRKERGRVYPDSGLRLAEMQMQSGNYEEAKQTWRRVRDQFENSPEGFEYRKALQSMRSCDLATLWSAEPTEIELIPLPETVNSDQSEFNGMFNDDGSLSFTSLRGAIDSKGRLEVGSEDYYPRSYKADSSFKDVALNDDNILSEVISTDEEYIARLIREDSGNLKIRVEKGSEFVFWLPNAEDSAWYSHPDIGYIDGENYLFFSSDREGGFGQEDIWFIRLDDENRELFNAGAEVNSPGREVSPFFKNKEGSLYFASDWHHGFGGFDIFSSEISKMKFQKPINLKKPYNSPSNDLYYHLNENIGKGSITSNRKEGSNHNTSDCCNDLWIFNQEMIQEAELLPEITSLEQLNDYLPVKLYFHNDEPNPGTRDTTTSLSYYEAYTSYIRQIEDYRRAYSKGLSDNSSVEAEEAMERFFIEEVDQGLVNLELFSELLLRELKSGARVELTVKGFASPLAETDYNVKLTARRISSLENYLRGYSNGALLPYLDADSNRDGTLRIVKIPFGEYVANSKVSDNPNEADAIYSIGAALERKIEIVSIQEDASQVSSTNLDFNAEIIDLGFLNTNESKDFTFSFNGSSDLEFDEIIFDETVLTILQDMDEILLENRISGRILAPLKTGKQTQTILLNGNFRGGTKTLTLTFEVK